MKFQFNKIYQMIKKVISVTICLLFVLIVLQIAFGVDYETNVRAEELKIKGGGTINITSKQAEIDNKAHLIIFKGNVVVIKGNIVIEADNIEVYLDGNGENIEKAIATGNVKFNQKKNDNQKERFATGEKAVYFNKEQKIVLTENPKIWEEDKVVTGERMTFFIQEDRSVVEGGQNQKVNVVVYPEKETKDGE